MKIYLENMDFEDLNLEMQNITLHYTSMGKFDIRCHLKNVN